MLESKLWHSKTETKNVNVAKMVEFIKTCDEFPRRFNFGNLFNSIMLPPLYWRKNRSSENAVREEWVSFSLGGGGGNDKKTLGRVLLEGMSKNEQIQFFDSQIYLFASNLNMVEYTGLGKNPRKILERQTP